jgi:hypothetical protein
LGYVILEEGITIDPEKVEYIRGWPTPKNITQVMPFMGLDGYYKRFIKKFSKIIHSITSLHKKGIKFEWKFKCEASFMLLKELLTSALILKIKDSNEYFMVCIDASKEGIGRVLN